MSPRHPSFLGHERAPGALGREDNMSPTEQAWAAGFWDGEGSCSLQRDRSGRPRFLRLYVSQKLGPELPLRFQAAVGGYGRVQERNRPGRTSFAWTLSKRDEITKVMAALWPYLGDVKKQQYLDSLTAYEAIPNGRRCGTA